MRDQTRGQQSIDRAGGEPIFRPGDERARRRRAAAQPRSSADAPQNVRPGRGISITWSTTSAPSAKIVGPSGAEKRATKPSRRSNFADRITGRGGCQKAARKHSSNNPEILPESASRAGAVAGENQLLFSSPQVVADLEDAARTFGDLGGGRRGAEAEPQSARNHGLVEAHRHQRGRGFARAAGAGGAGRTGDAGLVERDEQRLPIEADEGDVRRVRQAVRRRRRSRSRRASRRRIVRSKSSRSAVSRSRRCVLFGVPEFERGEHADGERDRFGAGAEAGLLEAAEELRREVDAVADDERADAERAVEFVGGEAHRRGAERAEVDGEFADDLGGVGVERDAALRCRWRRSRRRAAGRRFRCWPRIAVTRRVSGCSKSGRSATRRTPLWSTGRSVDLCSRARESSSARAVMLGCSMAEMMRCGCRRIAARRCIAASWLKRPRMARLFASVPPLVKTTRVGVAAGQCWRRPARRSVRGRLRAGGGRGGRIRAGWRGSGRARRSRRASPRSLPAAAAWWRCGRDRSAAMACWHAIMIAVGSGESQLVEAARGTPRR